MNEVKFKANIKDVLALQSEVEAIPEIPTPVSTDEGKVLTVTVDSSGETPVVSYELETPSGGLPAISAGDAGKVLTVNAGETGAEWAAAGGGNSPLIATSSYDETAQLFYLDKTFGEIRTAINAGRPVLVVSADTSASFDSNTTSQIGGYAYTIGLDPEYPEASGSVDTTVAQMTFDVICESAPYTLAALDALYPAGQ